MTYNFDNKFIPPNYIWEKDGLVTKKNETKLLCSNAIPIVAKYYCKQHAVTGVKQELIDIYYLTQKGTVTETTTFNMVQINKDKFMDNIPKGVVIYPDGKNKTKSVFHTIIQLQLADASCEVEMVYDLGWNNNFYYTGEFEPQFDELDIAVNVLELLCYGNTVVTGCILGGLHGYLTKPLLDANVDHNFITYIYGKESSTGKSTVPKYLAHSFFNEPNFFSIQGKRNEIKQKAVTNIDRPLLLDDVAETASDRIRENLKAITAEITQLSSDACAVIVNGKPVIPRGHYIISAQIMLNVVATVNRYFLCNMPEPLKPDLWAKVEGFKHKSPSFHFFFVRFLNNNFDSVIKQIKAHYSHFLSEYNKNTYCVGNSNYRIASTLAVQKVIKQIMYIYFKSLNVDTKLLIKAMKAVDDAIISAGYDTGDAIDEINNHIREATYIPVFHKTLFENIVNHKYYISRSENDYMDHKDTAKKAKGRKYGKSIGFLVKNDYLAFEYEEVFKLMKRCYPTETEDKTPMRLLKELNYFNMTRIDTDGRGSHKWGNREKYHFIDLKTLYEFMYEYGIKNNMFITDTESICYQFIRFFIPYFD